MSQHTRIALIGAGKVAALHAQALVKLPDVDVVAVCDPVAERAQALARSCGARVSTFDDALADPAIDAVILATPSELHATQVRQCIRAGKHGLCEFPLFAAPARLESLFALARHTGARWRVAHTTHYLSPYVEAKRILQDGGLGRLHTAIYRRRLYRPGGIAPDRDWRDNALTHLGGHALDLLTWLMADAPQQLRVVAWPSAQAATVTGLLLEMAGGAVGHISIDFESRPNGIWLEVACSSGTLTVQGFNCLEVNGRVEWQAPDDDSAYHAAIAAQDHDFVRSLLGEQSMVSPVDTLQLNEWMARAVKSARRSR